MPGFNLDRQASASSASCQLSPDLVGGKTGHTPSAANHATIQLLPKQIGCMMCACVCMCEFAVRSLWIKHFTRTAPSLSEGPL